jgi:hypothetical protein
MGSHFDASRISNRHDANGFYFISDSSKRSRFLEILGAKVTVRQVAPLANLRTHTAVVQRQPV